VLILKSLALATAEMLQKKNQILGSFPSPGHAHFLYRILLWALATFSHKPILESLALAKAVILKGDPQTLEARLA